MSKQKGKVIRLSIEDEIKESYLNYAMSVIVARALPDVRDGLKPVHRRILYVMNELGLRADRSFVKTGRIVGDALGKYHPCWRSMSKRVYFLIINESTCKSMRRQLLWNFKMSSDGIPG